MVVLKCVPFRFLGDFFWSCCRYHNFVFVCNGCKSLTIVLSHFIETLIDIHLSLLFNTINKHVSMWRITYTLEEFNPFLSLKLFKFSVLLEKILFIRRHFYVFQIQKWLSNIFAANYCAFSKCIITDLFRQFFKLYPCLHFSGLKQCLGLWFLIFVVNWVVESLISVTIQIDFGCSSDWCSITNDSNGLYLGIELTSSDLNQSFSGCERLWVVLEVDGCQLHSKDFTL